MSLAVSSATLLESTTSAPTVSAATTSAPTAAVSLQNIGKRYGDNVILADINLALSPGKTVLLWGSNGAGKTTLLKLIASRLRPSAGQGQVFGLDLLQDAAFVRELVCYAPVLGGFYGSLTGRENLDLARHFYGASQAALDEALTRVGLADAQGQLVRRYSSGMKKRLALAKVQLSGAALWLLDEPYASLDERGKTLVDDLLQDAKQQQRTVIVASHDLARAYALADGAMYIDQGRVYARSPEVSTNITNNVSSKTLNRNVTSKKTVGNNAH